ncbi:MAG: hypothetical protein U9R56_03385 [candidate division Zixibacteria bacterium]|nr:hypothetical protein [candidate division Zixibacteria bacterium]
MCPNCGQNLNNGECECYNEEIDERWEDLRKLSGKNNAKYKE